MPIDAKIRHIIKNNTYIKIDDMMCQVLSANLNSYYKSIKNIGREGDFITSPEISQLFGEILALWAIEKWQDMGFPKEFALIELGAGRGKLMQDLLRTAKKILPAFYHAAKIHLLEINPNFIQLQQDNLSIYNKDICWIDDIAQIPKLPSIIIANEFFDALPIKQYKKIKNKWFESILVIDSIDESIKFDTIDIDCNLQKHLLSLHQHAQDGAIFEESPESLDIVCFISKHIIKHKGASLIIDYGYNIATNLRTKEQYNSTLQAVKNHQYHSVINSLGKADLTAHVDFNALKRVGFEQGIKSQSFFSQGEFLIKYGIEIRLEGLQKQATKIESDILERQVFRLVSAKQMGNLFKILESCSIKS